MSKSTYYQGHSASSQARHSSRNASNTCQYFTHLLKPTMRILDVGCGPGSISATLAPFVPDGKVIGIDQSDTTLERARNQPNLPSNCTFQTGDALKLDFPEDTFDVVHTSQVLCHIPDPIAALKEFRRVLKPGGFVAIREGDNSSTILWPEHPGLAEWRRVVRETLESSGGHPEAGRRLTKWAVDAGFDIAKCTWTAGDMSFTGKEGAPMGLTLAQQQKDDESYRKNVLGKGVTSEDGLKLISEGWEVWSQDPFCIFSMICGQVVAYK